MKIVGLLVAAMMIVAGTLWTGQALGWFGDAPENAGVWAVVGPLMAGLGVALAISIIGAARRSGDGS